MKNKLKFNIIAIFLIISTFTSFIGVNAVESSTQESQAPKNISELIQGEELEAFLNMDAPNLEEQKIYFTYDEVEDRLVTYNGFANYGVGDLYNLTVTQKQYKYFITVSGFNHWGWWSVIYNPIDDKYVYCIDVATPIEGGSGYVAFSYVDVITDVNLRNDLRIIGTYGQKLQRDGGGDLMYFATNLMVWERQGGYNGYTTDAYGNIIDLSSQRNQINSAIVDHYKSPSFNTSNITLKIGESTTLTDTNGVMKDYLLKYNNTGVSVTQNGNNITITANNSSNDGKIEFVKNENLVYPSFVYQRINSQSIAQMGLFDPIFANINITVLQNGNLKLIKKDTNGSLVQGAIFDFSKNADMSNSTRVTTNVNGEILLNDYPQGDYYIREVSAPAPLVVDNTIRKVTITANTTNTEELLNAIVVGYIDGYKFESSTSPQHISKNLQGAVYEVKNSANVVVDTITTNVNGYFKTKNLPLGKYTLKEIQAPVGYNLDPNIYTVDLQYKDFNTPIVSTSISLNDKIISGRIKVVKTTDNGKTLLDGVVFGIYRSTDNVEVARIITGTDEPGQVTSPYLRYGDYYLKEISAPNTVYVSDTKYPFTIDVENEIEYRAISNERVEAKIKVIKKDSETNEPLEGVSFQIQDEQFNTLSFKINVNGKVVEKDTFVTDEEGSIFIDSYLPVGKYYLVESKPLPGYLPIAPLPFTIERNSNIITIDVVGKVLDLGTIFNKPTKVLFTKYQLDTTEIVTGAKMIIIGKDDGLTYGAFTTSEQPNLVIYLPIGNYILREVEAPNGYVRMDDVEFEVKAVEEIQEIDFTNDITKLSISKKALGGTEELKGNQLELSSVDGQIIDTWVNTEELHYIEKLPIGTYRLKELKPTDGYTTAIDVIFNVLETGEMQVVEMYNAPTTIRINKLDAGTLTQLPGNDLQVVDIETNEAVYSFTSSTTYEDLVGILTIGKTYRLEETRAVPGYLIAEPIEFTVEDTADVQEVTMINNYTMLMLAKTSSDTNEVLEGAKFNKYKLNKVDASLLSQEEIESDAYHSLDGEVFAKDLMYEFDSVKEGNIFERLEPGLYLLEEKQAPKGHDIATEPFVVEVLETGEMQQVNLPNNPTIYSINIKKIDSLTKEVLPGAGFTAYDVNGNVWETCVSDKNGICYFEMVMGEYTIKETSAPTGYLLSDEIINVNIDGTETDTEFTIEFMNTLLPAEALPKTGLEQGSLYWIGVSTLATGIVAVTIKKKKEQE